MKLKSIILFIFCIQAIYIQAQETYQITYEKFSNGKKVEETNPIQVLANIHETIIGTQNSFNQSKNTQTSYFITQNLNHQLFRRLHNLIRFILLSAMIQFLLTKPFLRLQKKQNVF